MGLDSVELVLEIEKFFEIQIPDQEAEKINTVQDFTDIVAKRLNITSYCKELQYKIHLKLTEELAVRGAKGDKITLTDKISDNLQVGNILYLNWKNDQLLESPKAVANSDKSILSTLKKQIGWLPKYDWGTISIEGFVDAICANNYKKLINPKEINSFYEVYISIVGITAHKIGVDIFEISPEKSFTKDLGID